MIRPRAISEEEFAAMVKKVGRGGVHGGILRTRLRDEAKVAGSNPAPSPYRSKWEYHS